MICSFNGQPIYRQLCNQDFKKHAHRFLKEDETEVIVGWYIKTTPLPYLLGSTRRSDVLIEDGSSSNRSQLDGCICCCWKSYGGHSDKIDADKTKANIIGDFNSIRS